MRRAILTMSPDYMAMGLGLEPGVSILSVRDNGFGGFELLLDGGSLLEIPATEPTPRVTLVVTTKIHPVFGGEYHEAHWGFSEEKRWPTLLVRSQRLAAAFEKEGGAG